MTDADNHNKNADKNASIFFAHKQFGPFIERIDMLNIKPV